MLAPFLDELGFGSQPPAFKCVLPGQFSLVVAFPVVLRGIVAEGGYLHLLIPGSPNEAPLQQLREMIKDEPRLRGFFESVYAEES